jgi:hypothetical protein
MRKRDAMAWGRLTVVTGNDILTHGGHYQFFKRLPRDDVRRCGGDLRGTEALYHEIPNGPFLLGGGGFFLSF